MITSPNLNAVLAHYPRLSWWQRKVLFARYAIAPFAEVLEFLPNAGTVLDVGCGWGILSHLIAEAKPGVNVLGIDLNPVRIEAACSSGPDPRVEFAVCDLTRESLPQAHCSAIVFFDLLHHLPPAVQERLLARAIELLGDGGTLLLKEIDRTPRWKYLWNLAHDTVMTRGDPIFCRASSEWRKLLEGHQLKVDAPRFFNNGIAYPHVLIVGRKIPA